MPHASKLQGLFHLHYVHSPYALWDFMVLSQFNIVFPSAHFFTALVSHPSSLGQLGFDLVGTQLVYIILRHFEQQGHEKNSHMCLNICKNHHILLVMCMSPCYKLTYIA